MLDRMYVCIVRFWIPDGGKKNQASDIKGKGSW